MDKNIKLTTDMIWDLSYADFIGFINQVNTPPGAYVTISKLRVFSKINKDSNLLEIACSTGFSSRELVRESGCRGIGIDASESSIKMAKFNKENFAPKADIHYQVIDGYSFLPEKKFTHVMVGGGLKFFINPQRMFSKCLEVLEDGGYILATPYYETRHTPKNLALKLHETIGIPLNSFSHFTYKEVLSLYNNLDIIYEDRNKIEQETDLEIEHYCWSVVERACKMHKIEDVDVRKNIYNRLFKIRKTINELREYQEYCVLVLRYDKKSYPNRYVPLY